MPRNAAHWEDVMGHPELTSRGFIGEWMSLLTAGLLLIAAFALHPAQAAEQTVYTFCPTAPCTDGATPFGGLVRDSSGNLYGTIFNGGANGKGSVFKLTPPTAPGGGWTETVLHSFSGTEVDPTKVSDGGNPLAGLIMDSSGNLYGTTSAIISLAAEQFFRSAPADRTASYTVSALSQTAATAQTLGLAACLWTRREMFMVPLGEGV